MSNMSYCRFQNTASDLRDCQEALQEILDNPKDENHKLSSAEFYAFRDMVGTITQIMYIIEDNDLTDNDGILTDIKIY